LSGQEELFSNLFVIDLLKINEFIYKRVSNSQIYQFDILK